MTRPDNPRGWIRKAESALAMARAHVDGALTEEYCFHAQQAAEKALKAVFVAHGLSFRFTHDIKDLAAELAERGLKLPAEIRNVEALGRITDYAVKIRYTTGFPDISDAERRKAVKIAAATVAWAKAEVARIQQ